MTSCVLVTYGVLTNNDTLFSANLIKRVTFIKATNGSTVINLLNSISKVIVIVNEKEKRRDRKNNHDYLYKQRVTLINQD